MTEITVEYDFAFFVSILLSVEGMGNRRTHNHCQCHIFYAMIVACIINIKCFYQ